MTGSGSNVKLYDSLSPNVEILYIVEDSEPSTKESFAKSQCMA